MHSSITTTVYQFGFSEETDAVVAFAYRSTSNFDSDRLPFGTGVKPECTVPKGNLFEHLEAMMNEQRAIQATRPVSERIFIGGEAVAIHLTKKACTFTRLFEFSDFKTNTAEMFRSYGKNAL